ncbi:unnamed protein product [Sphagnum tenellum]
MPLCSVIGGLNVKMKGKPISVVARPVQKNIIFGLKYSVVHPRESRHLFRFDRPLEPGKTPNSLADRWRFHMNAGRALEMNRVFELYPSVSLDVTDPKQPFFVIELPPHSSIYGTYENLFVAMGLEPSDVQPRMMRMTNDLKTTMIFGLSNRTDNKVIFKGAPLMEGIEFSDITGETPPTSISMVILMENVDKSDIKLLNKMATTKDKVILGLDRLLEEGRRRANLVVQPIELISVSDKGLLLANRPFAGCKSKIQLLLNEETSQALGLTYGLTIDFVLDQQRSFSAEVDSVGDDPFKGLYPVTMLTSGFGVSDCWLEGRGYVPMLGVIMEGERPIQGEGVTFNTDRTFMTVEFFDKTLEQIAFQEETEIFLKLMFQSL